MHEHDVGHVARGLRAALHGDAQVGLLERQHVVDAIARHTDVAPLLAQRAHDVLFLLRRDAAEDVAFGHGRAKGSVAQIRQFRPGDETQRRAGFTQPGLERQRGHRLRVVARDYLDGDAGLAKAVERGACFGAQLVGEAQHGDGFERGGQDRLLAVDDGQPAVRRAGEE